MTETEDQLTSQNCSLREVLQLFCVIIKLNCVPELCRYLIDVHSVMIFSYMCETILSQTLLTNFDYVA